MKKGTKLVLLLFVLAMMVWVTDPRSSFSQQLGVSANHVICCNQLWPLWEEGWTGSTKCDYMRTRSVTVQERLCQRLRASGNVCSEAAFFCPPKAPPSKPPCEKAPGDKKPPPWFGCGNPLVTERPILDVQSSKALAGEPIAKFCVATYNVCGKDIAVSKPLVDDAVYGNRGTEVAKELCRPFFETHNNVPPYSICCDNWQQAVEEFARNRTPCNPSLDPDCDGLANTEDPFPLHPRPVGYTSNTIEAKFPFWKDFNNALPKEPCADCQWEFLDARQLSCRNITTHAREQTNEAQYKYQVKWKCPSTGREVITDREVTLGGVYCPRSGGFRP
jgi:hypothetical protein